MNNHPSELTPISLKASLFQLKVFSSTVDAKIIISGKMELMIPDNPAIRISFRVLVVC